MGKNLVLSLFIFTFYFSCSDDCKTFIDIVEITPEPLSVVSENDTIFVILEYSISDDIESDFGFDIHPDFNSTTEGMSFAPFSFGIDDKKGKISEDIPLSFVWGFSDLKHPIVLCFSLNKRTSRTDARTIARTEEIIYDE